MAESTVLRAPGKLVAKIDEFRRRIERQSGVAVTRQAAAQALLVLGLRAVTPKRTGKKK